MKHRHIVALATAGGLLISVWLANYLVNRYGPIRVWPTTLLAPAGVYVVGVAFLLRDTFQRFSSAQWGALRGQLLSVAVIGAGAGLSAIVSTGLAEASAAGFAASELTGLAVFWIMRGNTAGPRGLSAAVCGATLVAAAVDSYVFLSLAPFPHALDFFNGQFIAKVSTVAIAVPFVLVARRRYPSPSPAVL